MSQIKKYINFLFVIALSLQVNNSNAMESDYIAVSSQDFVQDGSKYVPTIIAQNSQYLAPALIAFAMCAVAERKLKVYEACSKKGVAARQGINSLYEDIKKSCVDGANACIKAVPMPGFVRSGLQRTLTYLFGSINDYVANHKKFAGGALLFHVVGKVIQQQTLGDVGAGISLAAGFVKSVLDRYHIENMKAHDETHNRLDGIETKIDNVQTTVIKSVYELKQDAEKNKKEMIDALEQKINDVSGQIKKVEDGIQTAFAQSQKAIGEKFNEVTTQVNQVEGSVQVVNSKVQAVDGKVDNLKDTVERGNEDANKRLIGLSMKLNTMEEKIHEIAKNFDESKEENTLMRGEFKKAREQLASAQENLTNVSVKLVNQMTELTTATKEEFKNISERTDAQLENLATKVDGQSRDIKDTQENVQTIQKSVKQLVDGFQQENLLLNALEKIGLEHNQRLQNLDSMVKGISSQNKEQFEVLESSFKQHETSLLKVTKSVSLLTKEQRSFKDSWYDLLNKMTTLESIVYEIQKDSERKALEIQQLKDLLAQAEERDKRSEEREAASDKLIKDLYNEFANRAHIFDQKLSEVIQKQDKSDQKLDEILHDSKKTSENVNYLVGVVQLSLKPGHGQGSQPQLSLTKKKKTKEIEFNIPVYPVDMFTQKALEAEQKLNE